RPGGERAHERLTGYLRSVRERFADYQELLVVNPEGQEVASTAPQPTSASLPQGWAKTIRQENAVVGDALWDDALKKGAVVFAVPIYQTGGRFLGALRSEEHTSELQSRGHLVCRLLLEKKKKKKKHKRHRPHIDEFVNIL